MIGGSRDSVLTCYSTVEQSHVSKSHLQRAPLNGHNSVELPCHVFQNGSIYCNVLVNVIERLRQS